MVAQTRKGRQIMTVPPQDKAVACVACEGDSVAVVGDNRKLLVFPLSEVNELNRGRGVRLQRYAGGGLLDVTVFTLATGLQWLEGVRIRTFTELAEWQGARAQAGKLVPKGFPRSGRFAITRLETP